MELVLVVLIWICTALLHVLIHKCIKSYFGTIRFASMGVYVFGLVLLFLLLDFSQIRYSLSAFYILLTIIYGLYYTVSIKDYGSPTSKIMMLLRSQPMTYAEIKKHFSVKELLLGRFDDLCTSQLVSVNNGKVYVSNRGRYVVWLIRIHRKIMGITGYGS